MTKQEFIKLLDKLEQLRDLPQDAEISFYSIIDRKVFDVCTVHLDDDLYETVDNVKDAKHVKLDLFDKEFFERIQSK